MFRAAPLLLVIAACGGPDPGPSPAYAPASQRVDSLEAACSRAAERVVLYRDRGQQMRLDEGATRVGEQADIPSLRAQNDQAGQLYERNRLARDCVRQNQAGPQPTDPRPAPVARGGS